MALKICGNCKYCRRYGSGIKGYHFVCEKDGLVETDHAEACKSFTNSKRKFKE